MGTKRLKPLKWEKNMNSISNCCKEWGQEESKKGKVGRREKGKWRSIH